VRHSDPALKLMQLIWSVDHQLQSVSKHMEARLGLTVPQRMTLLLIGSSPGMTASDIAPLLHLHPATVSGILRRLEAAGYLRKEHDEADGRRVHLSLTQRGVQANANRAGTFEGAVRRVLQQMTATELEAADKVLTQLAAELRGVAVVHQRAQRLRRDSASRRHA
jgi:MarR family transcriptional regulator, organic hydroperoxide resistance regulator